MTLFKALLCSQILFLLCAVIFVFAPIRNLRAQEETNGIERQYQSAIRPLLERYCFECHSKDQTEADIDLDPFQTTTDIRKQEKVWLKVRQMLDSRQMPPKDAEQPSDVEHQRMRDWVRKVLAIEAKAKAGDPGPVILRRLSNAEYNYSIRDLTGVESLDPTREFPIDGAAGEGFTNAGSGQGMSPAFVQKYLDAAKGVAEHAVLLPDGIRFSPLTTRRDQTDELLGQIQSFYRQFTEDGGGAEIDLQGIKFNTNQGGLLPLEKYLAATLAERDALNGESKTIEDLARERSLNPRYLSTLWKTLTSDTGNPPSLFIDPLREKWRRAGVNDAATLATEIGLAQKSLWKFNSVGHIGRANGPKSWMEAVSPIAKQTELRFALPTAPPGSDIVIYLTANDLGDGNEQDFVVWQRPRIEFKTTNSGPVRPPILLRDIRSMAGQIKQSIASESARTKQYVSAVAELRASSTSIEEISKARNLNPSLLRKWNALAGFGQHKPPVIAGHLPEKLTRGQGYEAINGWGSGSTPNILTNRSDNPISFLTLTVPARGVVVHPSPTLESTISWRSPIDARIKIEGLVADADSQCGNGASWRLQVMSKSGTAVLTKGDIENGRKQQFNHETIAVESGDVVTLVVNARNNDHSCDTTQVELKLSEIDGDQRVWDLASDVVDNVLNGNPLPDSYDNKETWHFCAVENTSQAKLVIPLGSALARWRDAVDKSSPAEEIDKLAAAVENVMTIDNADALNEPDKTLRQLLLDWKGPLNWVSVAEKTQVGSNADYGLDPNWFGEHPSGLNVDADDLCLQAPQVIPLTLPAGLTAGAEFVTTGILHAESGSKGSVQLQVTAAKPGPNSISPGMPILVGASDQAQRRVEAAINEFRNLFPPALCYARLVPVDEVVTLTLFYREDDELKRLMLNDQQAAELDRLWDQLFYVSQEPLKLVVAFEQIAEFATQDAPDLVKALAPMREPIQARAEAFEEHLLETEPSHIQAVLEFADRAWRRPLNSDERQGLRNLYSRLRDREVPHEQAIRLMLARVLTSPAFLYKLEKPASEENAAPVSNLELAVRLSYFLWSSSPDDELRSLALAGKLTDETNLIKQTERMLEHPRTRRLAIQFACQWLHLRDFDQNDDKNEKLYPEFAQRRVDMYEETVLFFEDMFRNDRSILDLLDADHTFLNQSLAKHYGIDSVQGDQWRRVDGVRDLGRGGVLGMSSFLASQSGASRTSPILRGNWIYETLLGERLPRPPAGVPVLPDEVPTGLSARQVVEHHSSVASCAKCHVKIDPFGFALEQYDAIGRMRPKAADTNTKLEDGTEITGIDGLRDYLSTHRRKDVVRQFCRKLLGYSLGRELQLSDEPLIDKMVDKLGENDYRCSVAIKMIVTSRQFREIRGRQRSHD